MEQQVHLDGGPEEWLRRIAVEKGLAIVPEPMAFALVASGLAERSLDGVLTATDAGRAHLEARGIPIVRRRPR